MPDALPVAEIVHAMPGRVRLRIAERRGDAAFCASVATGLSSVPGVYKVAVRPFTGSILLQHGSPLDKIIAAAQEARLFRVANALAPATTPAIAIDPKMAVGVGLSVLAVWQLTEGKILPRAVTLAWYAAHLLGLLSKGTSEGGE